MAVKKNLPSAIRRLDLGAVEHKLALRLTEPVAKMCVLGLRRFYTLCRENPRKSLAPSHMIDWAWHEHILMTKKYASDCQTVFGGFLHHQPELEPNASSRRGYARTSKLYFARFGEAMPGEEARNSRKRKGIRHGTCKSCKTCGTGPCKS
ncbi:MAG: hypothetical protein WDN10_03885 [bacterium]